MAAVFIQLSHTEPCCNLVCPFDEKLRLRSDGTKALTDSRALGISGKGFRGELTSRL